MEMARVFQFTEPLIRVNISFSGQFHAMVSSNKYYTTVIEDNSSNRIVSAATLVIELKFDQSHPKVLKFEHRSSIIESEFIVNIV